MDAKASRLAPHKGGFKGNFHLFSRSLVIFLNQRREGFLSFGVYYWLWWAHDGIVIFPKDRFHFTEIQKTANVGNIFWGIDNLVW